MLQQQLIRNNHIFHPHSQPHLKVLEYETCIRAQPPLHLLATQPVLFYSGGLESAFIAATAPATTHFIHLVHTPKNLNFEEVLPQIAYNLGYTHLYITYEYAPEADGQHNLQYSTSLLLQRLQHFNICPIFPVLAIPKVTLWQLAWQRNLSFNSCYHNDPLHANTWCGACWKCFLLETFYRCYNKASPILWKHEKLAQRYLQEYEHYLDTGYDPYTLELYNLSLLTKHPKHFW